MPPGTSDRRETSSPPAAYRADIDGLRAIAIVPVMLFHAGLPWATGGFTGVDIFFVITGYLMTRIILAQLEAQTFSFSNFLANRARRIMPALVVMTIAITVAALIVAPPRMLSDLGGVLVGLGLMASNLAFSRRSANYFDTPTEWNPLLHTWSLSVEAQFYLALPMALVVIWRWRRSLLPAMLMLAAVASFALSVWGTQHAPTATFYWLPMRAWEFLVGALVALAVDRGVFERLTVTMRQRVAEIMALFGVVAIAGSMIALTPNAAFPGIAALPACLGTAALLAAGAVGHNSLTRVLAQPLLVGIGKISYSLYLWHWPLLVASEKYQLVPLSSPTRQIAVLLAATLIATASWRWIEQPFRRQKVWRNARRALVPAIASLAACALIGLGILHGEGLPWRFPGYAQIALSDANTGSQPDSERVTGRQLPCFLGTTTDRSVADCKRRLGVGRPALVWGDSFAGSAAIGLEQSAPATWAISVRASPACPPLIGYHAVSEPACAARNDDTHAMIAAGRFEAIILVANWDSYLKRRKITVDDIARTITRLRARGLAVVLVGQGPVFSFAYPDDFILTRYDAAKVPSTLHVASVGEPGLNQKLRAATSANLFFDPMPHLCAGQYCEIWSNGHYLFRDHGHLTPFGSRRLGRVLLRDIERLR